MNDFPTMPTTATGLPIPCTRLLATSIPLHLPRRLPRITGCTRRRKRRLREKLERLDTIRYAPAIRAAAAEMTRRVMDKIEREIFANASVRVGAAAPYPARGVGTELQSGSHPAEHKTGSHPCLMGSPERTAARQQRGEAASSPSANARLQRPGAAGGNDGN